MDSTRTCLYCGGDLPDGASEDRKFCLQSHARRYAVAEIRRREIEELGPDHRRCNKCEKVKRLKEFHPDKRGIAGYARRCLACHRAKKKEWHEQVEKVRGYNHHPVDPQLKEKRCTLCRTIKPVEQYGLNWRLSDGYANYCKQCMRHDNRSRQGKRKGHASGDILEYESDNWWKNQMMLQKGKCAICQRSFDLFVKPQVDHCHETGRLRGLLCLSCNAAIGLLRDDPKMMDQAVQYLRDFRARLVV